MFGKPIAAFVFFCATAVRLVAAPPASLTNSTANPLTASTQMLMVVTKDWDAVPGVIRRFERVDASSPWKQVGKPIAVVVGRNGMGWGRGLNSPFNLPGPVKKEGDGKSPAGIFALSSVFGLAGTNEVKGLHMPYQQLTDAIECVDDTASEFYNRIVDRSATAHPDWNSSEKMRAVGDQYRLGVVIDHNSDPREPGGGSCVFMHIWKGESIGTSGCAAMAPANIEALVSWLDASAHPVLVQLPEAAFKKLKKPLRLP